MAVLVTDGLGVGVIVATGVRVYATVLVGDGVIAGVKDAVAVDDAVGMAVGDCSVNDLWATVRVGTPVTQMQSELERHNMWVPLAAPWAASTVGGLVATSSKAPLRMRYGAVRDLVLALTVVLPDGRVIRAGRPVVKNVAGYDMAKLFIGSYGTLGLITDVTLKLMPVSRTRLSLIVPVDDPGCALACGARLLPICLTASALLLCSGAMVPGSPAPYALVYTAEGMHYDVAAEMAQVREALRGKGLIAPSAVETPSGTDVWASLLSGASVCRLDCWQAACSVCSRRSLGRSS